jgi:cytochrome b6-f complex iron-sulfur subunit
LTAKSLPTDPSRRQVLCGLVVALLAPGALAACGDGNSGASGTTTTNPPRTSGATPATSAPGGDSAQALAQLADVPVGGGKLVDSPAGKVLIVQPTAGTVKAYNPRCTHQGTTVNPPQGGTITCPNHGSQFSADDGSVKKGPAAAPLVEIPVRLEGTAVVLV